MWKCSGCREEVEDSFDACWSCGISKEGVENPEFKHADEMEVPEGESLRLSQLAAEAISRQTAIPEGMLLSTTDDVRTHTVRHYLGVVAGQAVMGANVLADVVSKITDIIGGRSGTYEAHFARGRDLAMADMAREAKALGANGVIGFTGPGPPIGRHRRRCGDRGGRGPR